ncbi:uncharacterized protein N7500_001266 [Penicillium coprophilum]|uniref:uncharacterized protein n=1 Tax=Penicillium coprophilum TaxID=36646 RepID=UPI0023A44E97|nr:uncharacterized protein N7500_001266 [Penicillium coprophilum]KAJ5178567.1 hypothetical protein N7500_001266 [Penicillium coprophilum]
MAMHFVDRSKFSGRSVMQVVTSSDKEKTTNQVTPEGEPQKHAFASAITRVMFKTGRLTIPPENALDICGFLSITTIKSFAEASGW